MSEREEKKRGQVSLEYIIVMGFIFLMIIPLLVLFTTESNNIRDEINIHQAQNVARKISASAESVYYYGYPSKTTIKAYMPQNVQAITIENNEVVIKLSTGNGDLDIVEYTPVNITGDMQTFSGLHKITIQAMPTYVNVSSR